MKTTSVSKKNYLINLAVLLTALLGGLNILISYNRKLRMSMYIRRNYAIINPHMLSIHRALTVIIGFSLLFVSSRLYKRMRIAWIMTLCTLLISLSINVFRYHRTFNIETLIEILVIAVFAVYQKEFKKSSDPIGIRKGLLFGLLALLFTVLNTCFTIYVLNLRMLKINEIDIAVVRTLKALIYMDPSFLGRIPKAAKIFMDSSIIINWAGIIYAGILILKPLIYQPIVTNLDQERVRKLIEKYADNSISYVAVEDDKKYFFGKNVEGVIAYTTAAGVAVCAGDPICSDNNLPIILAEFIVYCKENDLDICFCQTLEKNMPLYTDFGFGSIKYGEEAMFELETYNLSGGKAAKIRNAINHASALGIYIKEYKPHENRDKYVEEQILNVSMEWMKNKKSSELSFMLGSISLDNPMDRRYFAAWDNEANMLGFIVFTPFLEGKGYVADVTRRRKNAPIGVMEKIIIEAFNTMKAEGVKWGSLGLAPLVNSGEDGRIAGIALEFIFENLNRFYGFKSLHHYKKKYGPSAWETRYLTIFPNMFSPKIAYSIVKAQNPKGVSDFIFTQLKSIFADK